MVNRIVFEYLYRDSGNFKAYGVLCLDACGGEADANKLTGHFSSDRSFVAEQVGIPPLYEPLWQRTGGPTADDHAFHEFVELREATEEEVRDLPVWGTLDELLQAFQSVKEWDVTLSPNCAT